MCNSYEKGNFVLGIIWKEIENKPDHTVMPFDTFVGH